MDISIPFKPNPLLSSSNSLTKTVLFRKRPTHGPRVSRQNPVFRVYSSANPYASDAFSWPSIARSIRVGSQRFWSNFDQSVKRETVFDFEEANVKVGELMGRVKNGVKKGQAEFTRISRIGSLKGLGIWRKTAPKGLKLKKYIEGPDGTLIHDRSYVGEDAWIDDPEPSQENGEKVIDSNERMSAEETEKLIEDLSISGSNKLLSDFDFLDILNSIVNLPSKRSTLLLIPNINLCVCVCYILMKKVRYHTKLPYTYFLDKLDSSEVDIPLDPFLFKIISSSGVEVDLLQKRQIHYFLKVLIALLPGLLILWPIRESVMLLHVTSSHFLYKKYNQLFDMAYAEIFILPVGDVGETKSMYKEVGVPLSGPPGTGKTLLHGHLRRKVGCPLFLLLVQSSQIVKRVVQLGSMRCFLLQGEIAVVLTSVIGNYYVAYAVQHAPAFIFVDEIDAIAGRHARKDPRGRATFEALIAQLDGDKEKTGVDRFSLRQALIFICATNRPDELDLEFVCPGRIDRLYIGLPDAKQRVQMSGVHTCLPYCWFFWGRYNLVNEAAIMSFVSVLLTVPSDTNPKYYVVISCAFSSDHLKSCPGWWLQVRKGHSKIYKQDIVDVLDKQLLEGLGVCFLPRKNNRKSNKGKLQYQCSIPCEDIIDQGYTTFGYMKMQMVVAHGGRCAESVVFGEDITDEGKDDTEKITKKTFPLLSPNFSFPLPLTPPYRNTTAFHTKLQPKSLREWQEYEGAVKRKDLARALRFLKSVEQNKTNNPVELSNGPSLTESNQPRVPEFGLVDGSERLGVMEGTRDVTPTVLNSATGLEDCTCFFKELLFAINTGSISYGLPILWGDFRPNCCNANGYSRQAGTQFWDEKMNDELAEGQLSGTLFDR
ncbi:hypothetical protein Pint_18129 [Pistacia integerrima]|uniref:Uncharacterized protein n=1 Tax=Pistacia integerrima TaxID=434235 RepID=A0ACC0YW14_9ROSI|nr:hypothetical protein Pint_18129 [Pistacia integerrima]